MCELLARRYNKVFRCLYPNNETPWMLQLQMQIVLGVLVDNLHSMSWVAIDDMIFPHGDNFW